MRKGGTMDVGRARRIRGVLTVVGLWLALAAGAQAGEAAKESAAERGRQALTAHAYIPPGWTLDAYTKVRTLWDEPSPDPQTDPEGYAAAFRRRYGLHPAPFPNDGLPMGLRRSKNERTGRVGITLDCMVCHGGSIGGQSYVGIGNTQLDLKALLEEMTEADGRPKPFSLFTLNSSRGTNNAGQIAVTLLNLRNPDLSMRLFPLRTGANVPELDTPAWWLLGRKETKYYDGRTDARAARSNMQFLLGDLTAKELEALEPTFLDIDAYLKSLKAPKYPFSVDEGLAAKGRTVFEANCAKCHGRYGDEGAEYPNVVVPIEEIGTDSKRLTGLVQPFIDHYNSTWLAQDYPVVEPMEGYQAPPLNGVWATAPYLHNGSVPTLWHVLKSSERPGKFTRPLSTEFDQYDRERVGWRYETWTEPLPATAPRVERMRQVDTSRFGMGNQGHTFGDRLSDDERRAVIEYLKTL